MRAKFPQFDEHSPGRGRPIACGPVVACAIARHADKVTSTSAAGSSSRRHQLTGGCEIKFSRGSAGVGSNSGAGGRARAVFRQARELGQGHSVEAELALSFRPLAGLAQDEEPDLRGGEAGGEEDKRRDDQSTTPAHAGTWP